MGFVKGWAICLIGITLLVSIAEMLLPECNTKKYVKVILNLMVMLVLLQPLGEVKGIVFESIELKVSDTDYETNDYILRNFESNLKSDIDSKFEVDSEVIAEYNEEKQVVVKEIIIKGKGDEIKDELKRNYGEVQISFK